jgi:hypothetical protein
MNPWSISRDGKPGFQLVRNRNSGRILGRVLRVGSPAADLRHPLPQDAPAPGLCWVSEIRDHSWTWSWFSSRFQAAQHVFAATELAGRHVLPIQGAPAGLQWLVGLHVIEDCPGSALHGHRGTLCVGDHGLSVDWKVEYQGKPTTLRTSITFGARFHVDKDKAA